jgi:hypothetical protein
MDIIRALHKTFKKVSKLYTIQDHQQKTNMVNNVDVACCVIIVIVHSGGSEWCSNMSSKIFRFFIVGHL